MKLKKEYIEKYLADFHYELTREQLEQDWRFDEQPYYKEKDCWCFHAKDGCWLEVSNCDIFEAFDVSDEELVLLRLKSENGCDFKSSWSNSEMKPITQLYRIVEGALKDDINMVMRYAKRLKLDNSMDIDWDKTEKGIQEILNAYNNRPANIATLDNDNSITITSTVLKTTDTADSNGRVYSKEALAKAAKEYMEKKKEEGEITHEVFFGPYKGTEDGRLVEVDFGEMYEDSFDKNKDFDAVEEMEKRWKGYLNEQFVKSLMEDHSNNLQINIDKEIKLQASWLANNFSTRNGYTSMEENLIKMGEFVKNRMLDKYNLKNE